MKKMMSFLSLILLSNLCYSAQWLIVTPENIDVIQAVNGSNAAGQPDGLYIALKNEITGEAASYCTSNNFVVIRDPRLQEKAYSGILYALSSGKAVRFYLNGAGQCAYDGPVATIFDVKL